MCECFDAEYCKAGVVFKLNALFSKCGFSICIAIIEMQNAQGISTHGGRVDRFRQISGGKVQHKLQAILEVGYPRKPEATSGSRTQDSCCLMSSLRQLEGHCKI